MFKNLLAEMVRHSHRITICDIANCIGVSEKTARNYLNGVSKISWLDVLKIKRYFFPNLDVDYLFAADDNQRAS